MLLLNLTVFCNQACVSTRLDVVFVTNQCPWSQSAIHGNDGFCLQFSIMGCLQIFVMLFCTNRIETYISLTLRCVVEVVGLSN